MDRRPTARSLIGFECIRYVFIHREHQKFSESLVYEVRQQKSAGVLERLLQIIEKDF